MKIANRWNVGVHYQMWRDRKQDDDYVSFHIESPDDDEAAAWHAGLTEAFKRKPLGHDVMSLHVSPYYEEGGEEGLRMIRCSYVFPAVAVKDETAH